jgi:hypothetical protein
MGEFPDHRRPSCQDPTAIIAIAQGGPLAEQNSHTESQCDNLLRLL